jgi:small conductance mechanosensitive channel
MENLIEHWPSFLHQHLISIAKALLLSMIGLILLKRVRRFFHQHLHTQLKDPTLGIFALNAISSVIVVAISIIVLEQLGIPTSSLITLLAASSLAIGLALRSSLSNIAGGLMLLVLRPFKIGDYVDLGSGNEGYVTQINLFNTLLKTSNNQIVYLPNLKLIDSVIVNYNQTDTRRIEVNLSVTYNQKIKYVKQIITSVYSKNAKILTHPKANISIVDLTDSGIHLTLQVWVSLEDYSAVKASLYEHILEEFAKHNITLVT